jgi:hypothetical protein
MGFRDTEIDKLLTAGRLIAYGADAPARKPARPNPERMSVSGHTRGSPREGAKPAVKRRVALLPDRSRNG